MADGAAQQDVFKFVALRPPDSVKRDRQKINFIKDDRQPQNTPAGELVLALKNADDPARVPAMIEEFISGQQFSQTFLQDDTFLSRIDVLFIDQSENPVPNASLVGQLEQIVDRPLANYYNNPETRDQRHKTWDNYYAFYMLSRSQPQDMEYLTRTLRLFHCLDLLVQGLDLSNKPTLAGALSATPLVPMLFTELPRPKPKPVAPPAEPSPQLTAEYKKIWANLIDAQRAVDEVKNLRYDIKTSTQTRKVTIPNQEAGPSTPGKVSVFNSTLAVNATSFAGLHANTKDLLKNIGVDERSFQPADAVAQIQTQLTQAHQALGNINDMQLMLFMPPEAKNLPGMSALMEKFNLDLLAPRLPMRPPTNIRRSIKPLGIGDLKVVKQKLTKYAAGDVAHIENVLRGEFKERKHRVLDRTEETLSVSTETEEETTRDTQSTERFELKKESENSLHEQMSVQAGVTVTASYGAVTFGAHGDFAYSTSSQQSNRNSTNFAKEVVDRSISRIQKRIKEERTSKRLHEVEELNTHGLDNRGQPDHMVGIYRWVDKYYEAQIYNYGKRLMFEFVIPEPAAYLRYAMAHPSGKVEIPPPLPFNLKFTDITEHNYMDFVMRYNVQGVTPPPLPWKTVSVSLSKDAMPLDGNAHVLSTKELLIPEGYWSRVGVWFDCSAYFSNFPRLEITIGNKIFRLLENNRSAVFAVANNASNNAIKYAEFSGGSSIQISVNSYDVISYTINAHAFVERNWETYQKWQIQVWEKISATYQALKADYDQKNSAQQTQDGVVIQGQNPRINREIEKTELKKHCIKMLMDTTMFGSFDAMKQANPSEPPDFDIFDAFSEGKIIQFFEQAFEWENITYLFYPYFWGRYPEWINKLKMSDTDPLFNKFMQAGSCKVVLPVHKAYDEAVMHFLENNGAIWNGGDTPLLNDPLYMSIAEELRNQTDDLFGAKPEGDPWEVILPTTLVYLQKDGELPVFPVNP